MHSMGASNGSSYLARWRNFIATGDEGIRFSAQLQATITPPAAPAAPLLTADGTSVGVTTRPGSFPCREGAALRGDSSVYCSIRSGP